MYTLIIHVTHVLNIIIERLFTDILLPTAGVLNEILFFSRSKNTSTFHLVYDSMDP